MRAHTLERLAAWDRVLCRRFNRASEFAVLRIVFVAASRLGNGIFWYALMLALLVKHGVAAALPVLHMAFVGIVCTAAYQMLKRGTVRPRPYETLQGIAFGAVPLDRFSFPSGHTLHAVAFSLVGISHYPGLAAPLTTFTVLTASSRVVLGLHYPSDVLAGAALGGLVAALSFGI